MVGEISMEEKDIKDEVKVKKKRTRI